MIFELDDAKAASNYRRHKITFEQAREVFADPFIIDWATKDKTNTSSVSTRSAWLSSLVRRLHDEERQDQDHFSAAG
jgi:uncharacterized DUF497 family protein